MSVTLQQTSNPKGTIRYMAYEVIVCESNPRPSKESDVWAFGMTVYVRSSLLEKMFFLIDHLQKKFVLTGSVPYEEYKLEVKMIQKILSYQLPLRPELWSNPTLEAEGPMLWNICEDCWRKLSEERPTISSIKEHLDQLSSERDSADPLVSEDVHVEFLRAFELPSEETYGLRKSNNVANIDMKYDSSYCIPSIDLRATRTSTLSSPGSSTTTPEPEILLVTAFSEEEGGVQISMPCPRRMTSLFEDEVDSFNSASKLLSPPARRAMSPHEQTFPPSKGVIPRPRVPFWSTQGIPFTPQPVSHCPSGLQPRGISHNLPYYLDSSEGDSDSSEGDSHVPRLRARSAGSAADHFNGCSALSTPQKIQGTRANVEQPHSDRIALDPRNEASQSTIAHPVSQNIVARMHTRPTFPIAMQPPLENTTNRKGYAIPRKPPPIILEDADESQEGPRMQARLTTPPAKRPTLEDTTNRKGYAITRKPSHYCRRCKQISFSERVRSN